MKMTRIALAMAAAAVVSTPALATNGDQMIGLGAQSRALGGTGTAAFYGSESALSNPALIAKSQGTEFAFGGTLFKPAVKATSDVKTAVATKFGSTTPTASANSAADTNVIPEVSLAQQLNSNLSWGIGMFGSAGMGVDYKDEANLFNGSSNLQIMKFAPTIAYKTKNFGFGFSPIVQYGSLDINYTAQVHDKSAATATRPNGNPLYTTSTGAISTASASGPTTPNTPLMQTIGAGVSSDLGMGYNLGAYFDVMQNLTVALAYQSAIDMKYKNQITTAAGGFGLTGFTDHLEQPAQISAGVAYTMGSLMFTGDYKQIAWGSAKGYKDFNWKDQNVVGLGVKYSSTNYWAGVGYNYGDDPIKKLDASTNPQVNYKNAAINTFNNHFFPGIVTSHITFGGGYNLGKNTTLEGAVVYAPEVNKTIDTSAISSAFATEAANSATSVTSSHKVTHSQVGYTVSVKYNF